MHWLLGTHYHDKRKHLLKMHISDYYVRGLTGGFETNQWKRFYSGFVLLIENGMDNKCTETISVVREGRELFLPKSFWNWTNTFWRICCSLEVNYSFLMHLLVPSCSPNCYQQNTPLRNQRCLQIYSPLQLYLKTQKLLLQYFFHYKCYFWQENTKLT